MRGRKRIKREEGEIITVACAFSASCGLFVAKNIKEPPNNK
jgi:hypothetical protein